MHAVVVYESMFGNTHLIAERIGDGVRSTHEVETTVVSVHDATAELIATADLLVVGGPTHVHGMTSDLTRRGVEDMAAKDDLALDPDWEGPGLREWFDALEDSGGRAAAAFDTRVHASALLTGQASKGIAKRLRHHGWDIVVDPESFFVDKSTHLEPDEADRATAWGTRLATTLTARQAAG